MTDTSNDNGQSADQAAAKAGDFHLHPSMPGYAQAHFAENQALQRKLKAFWSEMLEDVQDTSTDLAAFKTQQLPLARIKKIMKSDEDVRMISAEAPVLFAKACEFFILEMTHRAWNVAQECQRRTLQRSDIAVAIARTHIWDFLLDTVPLQEAIDAMTAIEGDAADADATGGIDPAAADPPQDDVQGRNPASGEGVVPAPVESNPMPVTLPPGMNPMFPPGQFMPPPQMGAFPQMMPPPPPGMLFPIPPGMYPPGVQQPPYAPLDNPTTLQSNNDDQLRAVDEKSGNPGALNPSNADGSTENE